MPYSILKCDSRSTVAANREKVEIETINLLNLLIWMGKLTWV